MVETIYEVIERLEHTQPKSVEEARGFLNSLSEEVQEQLIASIYIGKDHIHSQKFNHDAEVSRLTTGHIEKEEYPAVLSKYASSLRLYFGSLKRCAGNESFDLTKL